MGGSRISYYFRSKYPVCVRILRRHKAVGGPKNGCGKVVEFLLLVLPCSAVVPLKMRVLV